MDALLSCTWPAAPDVYGATVLQSSFSVTFHTLLPSIIAAVARNLRHSELCVIHAPCYANMSATLFACRPSNINQMFTRTAWHLSFGVRVECNSRRRMSFFSWGNPWILWCSKRINGICFLYLVGHLRCTVFCEGWRQHISKSIVQHSYICEWSSMLFLFLKALFAKKKGHHFNFS